MPELCHTSVSRRLSSWSGLFDRVDGGYWFLDLVCGGATRATSKKLMLDTTTQDGKRGAHRVRRGSGAGRQEPGASPGARTQRVHRNTGPRESGDKVTRFGPFSSQCRVGNVKIRRGPWNEELIRVLEGFPDLAHDDEVDACSGALEMLNPQMKGWGSSSAARQSTYSRIPRSRYWSIAEPLGAGGAAATSSATALHGQQWSPHAPNPSARGIHRDPSVVIAVCNGAISRRTALDSHHLSPEKLNSWKVAFELSGTKGLLVSYRYVSGDRRLGVPKGLGLSECRQSVWVLSEVPFDFLHQVSRLERILENMVRTSLCGEDRCFGKTDHKRVRSRVSRGNSFNGPPYIHVS